MNNREVHTGGYPAALLHFQKSGGLFYPCKTKDGSSTVVCGRNIHTFWEEDSRFRPKVLQAARDFNLEGEDWTSGRIARAVLKEVLKLDTSQTFYHERFRKLALSGHHWHYLYVTPGYHPYLLEFDIRSAYAACLLSGDSLLYDYQRGYIKDGGTLENLAAMLPIIPKWLRMSMLGVMASHKIQFFVKSKDSGDSFLLKSKVIRKIDYAAAFNATHKAILRLYRIMAEIHKIGGKHIARIHTDSFAFSPEIPVEVESRIFEILQENGLDYSLKGSGSAYFWDVNCGVLGKKIVGGRADVMERVQLLDAKPKREFLTVEAYERWKPRLKEYVPQDIMEAIDSIRPGQKQLELEMGDLSTQEYGMIA